MRNNTAFLGNIVMELNQNGDIIISTEIQDPDEVVKVLDSGTEPYENSHTIAGIIRLFTEHANIIDSEITKYSRVA